MAMTNRVSGKTVEVWDRDPQPNWMQGCGLLVMCLIAGFTIGFIVGSAPHPSSPATTPRPDASEATGSVGAAAQAQPSASPLPTGAVGSPAEGRRGIIAYADESLGSNYLAIPIGPGHLVKICGPAACWTTVSTDAGPNHERLLAGRIADVAVGQWERICGQPRSAGTCRGVWQTVDTPLPATDR